MSNDNNSTSSSIILATIVGGVVGAAIGVMLAPKAGKETRQDISIKAKETWSNLDLIEEGKGVLSDIRDALRDLRKSSGKGSQKDQEQATTIEIVKDEDENLEPTEA